jgi:S1-C subfamily serine protease
LIVAECPTGSAAYQMGLRTGDFIQAIDGRPLKKVEDFLKAVANLKPDQKPSVSLRRNQQMMKVPLDTSAAPPSKP